MRRVVVTGLGAVTPLGVGVKRTWSRLINGECGITSTTSLGAEFAALPSQVAGMVPVGSKESGGWKADEWCTPTEIKQAAKFAQYGLAATEEALRDAGFEGGKGLDGDMTGVCLGSGIGNLEDLYNTSVVYNSTKNYRKIHPLFVPRLLINLGAGHISMRYGFRGPSHSATTACTTGAHSIGDAARFIQHGDATVMIAGGAESCIHPLAIGGFARSRSLATKFNDRPQEASRPFDRDRDGFVIGEGAAVLVLEDYEHAKSRSAHIYAELTGYGTSSDAHHLTAPAPHGTGALSAMRRALLQSSLHPHDISYINAHATSTPLGDLSETTAIKTLMLGPDGVSHPEEIILSSTKGATGHLLGAAGAIEALFCVLAVKSGVVPPTVNLRVEGLDRSKGFDCGFVMGEGREVEGGVRVAVSNSFGFGGTNASLCFRRV